MTSGRTSSVRRSPLRSLVAGSVSAASRRATAGPASVPAGSASSHVTDVTLSCSDDVPAGQAAAATATRPAGSTVDSRPGRSSTSTSPSTSASTYSAVDSAPTGSASPKLRRGRGVYPALVATGTPARRIARSQARAVSRWLMKRTLPSLA